MMDPATEAIVRPLAWLLFLGLFFYAMYRLGRD